jgi:hypothetical protein
MTRSSSDGSAFIERIKKSTLPEGETPGFPKLEEASFESGDAASGAEEMRQAA